MESETANANGSTAYEEPSDVSRIERISSARDAQRGPALRACARMIVQCVGELTLEADLGSGIDKRVVRRACKRLAQVHAMLEDLRDAG